MNMILERTRMKYRGIRESAFYSILDIEFALKTLSWEGLIWCLKNMQNLTEAEKILISHYLSQHRENQVYDDVR